MAEAEQRKSVADEAAQAAAQTTSRQRQQTAAEQPHSHDGGVGGDDVPGAHENPGLGGLLVLSVETAQTLRLAAPGRRSRGWGRRLDQCASAAGCSAGAVDAVRRAYGSKMCELFEGACGYGCGCHNVERLAADWLDDC